MLITFPNIHKVFLTFLLFTLMSITRISAQNEQTADSVNRDDPDFVTASLLIASPGEVLYSCVGHACLRLQCPSYDLDYIFSYESEDVRDKVLSFFAGNLKMGMLAIPTQEYLSDYKSEGRGVKQYRLNLPIEVKRNLWQLLDNKVSEGTNLPYDFLSRGCAQSTLQSILEALVMTCVEPEFAQWPQCYEQTRREFVATNLNDYPWTRFVLFTIVGIESDAECTNIEKVVIPHDLLSLLQTTKINGTPIITDVPQVLLAPHPKSESFISSLFNIFTPTIIAIITLIFTVVIITLNRFHHASESIKILSITLISFQFLLGLFISYLIFFSYLPCTSWSWLIIPFNPLPLILWHWRSYWTLPYATILIIWELVMLLYSHQLTDPAYLIFVLSFILIYLSSSSFSKKNIPLFSRIIPFLSTKH